MEEVPLREKEVDAGSLLLRYDLPSLDDKVRRRFGERSTLFSLSQSSLPSSRLAARARRVGVKELTRF